MVVYGCYHCGSSDHRAKACPDAVCRICQQQGHDTGGCPQKPLPPVDLGSFIATTAVGDAGFSYIELFAGIGGFRVALDRFNGQCVFASEIDRFARANYELNHGDRPAGDITRISTDDIPEHDLLVGGFPCQPFSFSGQRQGLDDERGILFLEIVRILKARQPKGFLLENVRGLLTHDEGRTLQIILSKLEKSGYHVQHEILDAVQVVPQERKRIYLVGLRNDLVSNDCKSRLFFSKRVPANLKRGFEDIQQRNLTANEAERLPLSNRQLGKVRSQSYTQKFPEARFLDDISKPTKTLQSSYASYMVGSQFVPASHGKGWRRLSPREAARLQGFPEDFQLCSQRPYHLLGNAVVPSMIAIVAAPLLQAFAGVMENDEGGWKVAMELLLDASPSDERRLDLQHQITEASQGEKP